MDELRCLEFVMSRRKKDPLRPLTDDEVAVLTKLSRSKSESATRVARAALILAVARGCDYQQAAESIGRRSGDAVSHLVARFNAEGARRPRSPPRRRTGPALRPGRSGTHPPGGSPPAHARGRRHRLVELDDAAEGPPLGPRWPAPGLHLHHRAGAPRGGGLAAEGPAPGAPPAPCSASGRAARSW